MDATEKTPFVGAERPLAGDAPRARGSWICQLARPRQRVFAATGIQRSVWREGARPMGGAPGLDPRKGCGRPLSGRQVVAHGSSGSRTRQKHRPCRTGWRRQDLAGRGHALRLRQDAAHGHDPRRQVVPRLRPRGDQAQVHHLHLHCPHPLQGLQDQRAGHLRPSRLHR